MLVEQLLHRYAKSSHQLSDRVDESRAVRGQAVSHFISAPVHDGSESWSRLELGRQASREPEPAQGIDE